MSERLSSSVNLDSLSMVIIDALYQGDEARLQKAFSELNPSEQEVLKAIIDCWRSDTCENSSPLNNLISVSQNSVIANLIVAEKSLELGTSKLHDQFILRAFAFIDKSHKNLDKNLLNFYNIIKIKGFITNNDLDKAVSFAESLDSSLSKFIDGYKFYLLGLIYKLKSSRHRLKAEHCLREAIKIFELHHPNIYLLNLCKLHLSFFLDTSPSEISQIADQFKRLGCAKETNLALAQYNYIAKSKEGLFIQDSHNNFTSVDGYYFIGELMKDCLRRLTTIASANSGNVLILGEEGTGKEVFAKTIHRLSSRNNKPFISFNCAQLKNELFESEFFGYEKGAFTSADKPKRGLLEEANGGTLFLDEIAELTPQIQAKLLTVLQNGVFRRIGSNNEIKVNIRFIGATNRDLSKMIQRDKTNREADNPVIKETFRSDLVSRLPLKITAPTLDKRKDEILYLSEIFLAQLAPNEKLILDNNAKSYLLKRVYPSNIRSLKDFLNCVVICAIQNKTLLITDKLLSEVETFMELESVSNNLENSNLTFEQQMNQFGTKVISKALIRSNNNVKIAAANLGLAERTFYKYIKRYGIET